MLWVFFGACADTPVQKYHAHSANITHSDHAPFVPNKSLSLIDFNVKGFCVLTRFFNAAKEFSEISETI